jgi:hypothetical protein
MTTMPRGTTSVERITRQDKACRRLLALFDLHEHLTTTDVAAMIGTVPTENPNAKSKTRTAKASTVATWRRFAEKGCVRSPDGCSPPAGNYLKSLEDLVLPTMEARSAAGLNIITGLVVPKEDSPRKAAARTITLHPPAIESSPGIRQRLDDRRRSQEVQEIRDYATETLNVEEIVSLIVALSSYAVDQLKS